MCNFKIKVISKLSTRIFLTVLLLPSIFKCSLQTLPIAGDRLANPGDFPYQAFIRWDVGFKCGAVLIKVDDLIVALTISYCAAYWSQNHNTNTKVHVIAGNTNVQRTQTSLTQQEKYVVCHISNKLVPQHMNNNLAVLILDSQFDLSTSVNTIEMSRDILQSEQELEVIGWQKEAGKNSNVNSTLQVAELKAMNFTDCQYIFQNQCNKTMQTNLFCTKSPTKWTNSKSGLTIGSAVISKQSGMLVGLLTYSIGLDCNVTEAEGMEF